MGWCTEDQGGRSMPGVRVTICSGRALASGTSQPVGRQAQIITLWKKLEVRQGALKRCGWRVPEE